MSEKPAEIIQTLREADEQSKATIDAARKARDARLKEAATEAEAEIAKYRADREAKYQAQLSKFVGSTGETSQQIAEDAKSSIAATTSTASVNKPAVVAMLVSHVKNVSTSI